MRIDRAGENFSLHLSNPNVLQTRKPETERWPEGQHLAVAGVLVSEEIVSQFSSKWSSFGGRRKIWDN